MGVFKKFIGGFALESVQTTTGEIFKSTIDVIPYKNTSGETRSQVYTDPDNFNPSEYKRAARNGYAPYYNLIAVATGDDISDYSVNDYAITSVGSTSQNVTRTIGSSSSSNFYNVTITAQNDITVKCVKFHKSIYGSGCINDVLICGYYLDSPLTIPAGESRTITIQMKVGTDVSVSES